MDGRQSDEPEQPRGHLAAGSLVERRRTRAALLASSFNGGTTLAAASSSPEITRSAPAAIYQRATDPVGDASAQTATSTSWRCRSTTSFRRSQSSTSTTRCWRASRPTAALRWSDPEVVIRDLDANVFNDKQTITADPTDEDIVYAVWDRLVFPASERANVMAGFRTSAFRGPVWFARSTNGGTSWEPAGRSTTQARTIRRSATRSSCCPNGTLVDVFDEIRNDNSKKQRGFSVRVMRSTDKGDTWSKPIFIDLLGTIFVTDPESGDDVRTGDIIPDIAVGADTAISIPSGRTLA